MTFSPPTAVLSTKSPHYAHFLYHLTNMDRLTHLRSQYLELTNHVLPELAISRNFSVRYNHCFQRIILDNLFNCCWYEILKRKQESAYKQLTEDQLEQAIAIANRIIAQPDLYLQQLN